MKWIASLLEITAGVGLLIYAVRLVAEVIRESDWYKRAKVRRSHHRFHIPASRLKVSTRFWCWFLGKLVACEHRMEARKRMASKQDDGINRDFCLVQGTGSNGHRFIVIYRANSRGIQRSIETLLKWTENEEIGLDASTADRMMDSICDVKGT